MAHDRSNVVFERGPQRGRVQLPHPSAELVVPHERVPLDLHVVLLGERDQRVAVGESKFVGMRVKRLPFHRILGRDVVELARQDLAVGPFVRQHLQVHGRAHQFTSACRRVTQRR